MVKSTKHDLALGSTTIMAKYSSYELDKAQHEEEVEQPERCSLNRNHVPTVDAVFGEITKGGPNYRAVRGMVS